MKRRGFAKELNLKDLKVQIIVGIVLVLLILVTGFVFLSNQIGESCKVSDSELDGEMDALRPRPGITPPPVTVDGCRDSDGGINIYQNGTVTFNGQSDTDSCYSNINLRETYCAGNGIDFKGILCWKSPEQKIREYEFIPGEKKFEFTVSYCRGNDIIWGDYGETPGSKLATCPPEKPQCLSDVEIRYYSTIDYDYSYPKIINFIKNLGFTSGYTIIYSGKCSEVPCYEGKCQIDVDDYPRDRLRV